MTEGAIPPELYSTLVLATGSIYNASRALPGTLNLYFSIPPYQRTQTIQLLTNRIRPLLDSRAAVDAHFRCVFRKKLFQTTVDDGRATLDMATHCGSERDFALKVQALDGLLMRMNSETKSLIANPTVRTNTHGSINILETILKERFGDFDLQIISGLRRLNTLRNSMYPTHTLRHEVIALFRELGHDYPPTDWDQVWQSLLATCNRSLDALIRLLRQ